MSSIALTRQAPYPERVQQRRCDRCGKVVSRGAYACRRCGKAQRLARPRTVLVLGLAAALIGGMFAVASAGSALPQAHPAGVAAAPASPVAALVRDPAAARAPEVSATELWLAYGRDPAAADRTYRDRSLTVTGLVRSIDPNYEGDVVVRLAAGEAFNTVNATLATSHDPSLSGLAKGRVASLLCVGRGAIMGAPVLASCFVR